MTSLDRVVLSIYSIVSRDEAMPSMLEALAAHFRCISAVLAYVHPHRPQTSISIAFGPLSSSEVQRRYARDFAAFDPAPSAFGRLSIGQAGNTDAMFGGSLALYDRFLQGFYYPLGLRAALGGPIADQEGQIGLVAVHRGPDRQSFGSEDVAAMEALLPHISNAVDLRRRFFALEQQRDALGAAVEPLGFGLMLFDHGRLSEANQAARNILARGDGLALNRQGQLTATEDVASGRLAILMKSGGTGVVAVKRAGGGSYGLRVYGEKEPIGQSRRAVLICDSESGRTDAAQLIRDIYAVPAQCAQLIASLLIGRSLEQHAEDIGVSRNTAKFHLKAAFAATGTRRQIDLIRQVAPLVASLSAASGAA